MLNVFKNVQGNLEKDFSIRVRFSSFPISEAIFVKTAMKSVQSSRKQRTVTLRQAGTWDPLQCLHLANVPEEEIQRNYKGTKNNCTYRLLLLLLLLSRFSRVRLCATP